jgi:hypothetical protein
VGAVLKLVTSHLSDALASLGFTPDAGEIARCAAPTNPITSGLEHLGDADTPPR